MLQNLQQQLHQIYIGYDYDYKNNRFIINLIVLLLIMFCIGWLFSPSSKHLHWKSIIQSKRLGTCSWILKNGQQQKRYNLNTIFYYIIDFFYSLNNFNNPECKYWNLQYFTADQVTCALFRYNRNPERSLWSCISHWCMELSSSTMYTTYDGRYCSWKLRDSKTVRNCNDYDEIFIRDHSKIFRHGTKIFVYIIIIPRPKIHELRYN